MFLLFIAGLFLTWLSGGIPCWRLLPPSSCTLWVENSVVVVGWTCVIVRRNSVLKVSIDWWINTFIIDDKIIDKASQVAFARSRMAPTFTLVDDRIVWPFFCKHVCPMGWVWWRWLMVLVMTTNRPWYHWLPPWRRYLSFVESDDGGRIPGVPRAVLSAVVTMLFSFLSYNCLRIFNAQQNSLESFTKLMFNLWEYGCSQHTRYLPRLIGLIQNESNKII